MKKKREAFDFNLSQCKLRGSEYVALVGFKPMAADAMKVHCSYFSIF